MAPTLSVTLSPGDAHADGWVVDETASLDINLEALETPSGSESGTLPGSVHELEWEGETGAHLIWDQWDQPAHSSVLTDDLPRMVRGGARAAPSGGAEPCEGLMELDQVDASGRRWRRFCTCGQEFHVNMSVLEPYLQVLSHGGQPGSAPPPTVSLTFCSRPQAPPPEAGSGVKTSCWFLWVLEMADVLQRCDWLMGKI